MDSEVRLIKIGTEKVKMFDKKFDEFYDKYKKRAESMGYFGDLKFIKEKSKVFVYTIKQLT